MSLKIQSYGVTDIGLVRENNEDAWGQLPNERLYVLADGMGGHEAGEVASTAAVNGLCYLVQNAQELHNPDLSDEQVMAFFRSTIQEVNATVYAMGHENPEFAGMGTTLCSLYVHGNSMIYGHVGDSRIYCVHEGQLEQLTKDDSLVSQMIAAGQISQDGPQVTQYKNIITKAIGVDPTVIPSVNKKPLCVGDLYIMCSDGLTDGLSFKEIEALARSFDALEEVAKGLVEAAKLRGGRDNITVVTVKVEAIDEQAYLPR